MVNQTVEHLKNNQIDKSLWDECVDQSCQVMVYALSWYLDIVSPGWEGLVWSDGERYLAVMPIPIKRKWGFSLVYQPFFCQQLGLYSLTHPDESTMEMFIKAFKNHYKYAPLLTFNTNNALMDFDGIVQETRYTHHLSLNTTYEELFSRFKRDRRYRIQQAKRLGQQVVSGENFRALIDIFRDDTARKITGGVAEKTYDMLNRLFEEVKAKGLGELYFVLDEQGVPECGGWFVRYRGKIIYLFNASLQKARNKNGRSLILDHVIQKYAGTDQVLDFESPMEPDIAAFYHSFGSEAFPFKSLYYNNMPLVIQKLHQIKMSVHLKLIGWLGS